jgi:hypothetical protein
MGENAQEMAFADGIPRSDTRCAEPIHARISF